jgi:hypothetical protein
MYEIRTNVVVWKFCCVRAGVEVQYASTLSVGLSMSEAAYRHISLRFRKSGRGAGRATRS